MCMKKNMINCCMSHPVLCGMTAGFAVVGICGVVMACKKKAKCLAEAAKQGACECADCVCEMTEDLMERGKEALGHMGNMGNAENN